MSDKNKNKSNNEKREKGLAMMQMMNGMPDDLALSGSPETAPAREKKENRFLRLMSSPVAAVVLSVCVAFAVVVAIVRAGQGRAVTPGGNPGSSVSEREQAEGSARTTADDLSGSEEAPAQPGAPVEMYFDDAWHCYEMGGVYFSVHTMDTPVNIGSYLPGMSVRFAAYLTNVSGSAALSANPQTFYPTKARVMGHGVDYTVPAGQRESDPVETSVSRLGVTGPLTWFDIPAGLLTEQGHYAVELTYETGDGGLSAVIENMILVEVEEETGRTWGENPGLDGWTDMTFGPEIYAYGTTNGDAVCFTNCSGGPEGEWNSFGTRNKLVQPGTGWTAATSARQLQAVIGSFEYNAASVPADERASVEAAVASYTDSFFVTHDVLLFKYNTPSASDRYAVTRIIMDEDGTLRLTFCDECTDEERVAAIGCFLAVIPIEKGMMPTAVRTRVSPDSTGGTETSEPAKPYEVGEVPSAWTKLKLKEEAYAFPTPWGNGVTILSSYNPDVAQACFRTPQVVPEPGKSWIIVTTAQDLQKVLGSYTYDARYIPDEDEALLKETLASFTDSFFERFDALLVLHSTSSSSDRYVIDDMRTSKHWGNTIFTLYGHDANTSGIREDLNATFLIVVPIQKGLTPFEIRTASTAARK